jgi:hypothetical protein
VGYMEGVFKTAGDAQVGAVAAHVGLFVTED